MNTNSQLIERALGLRSQLVSIWQAGVGAVSPRELVAREIRENQELMDRIIDCRKVIILGAGKASHEMVVGALEALPPGKETIGWIHVIDGKEKELGCGISLIPVRSNSENYPTDRGMLASKKMMEMATSAGEGDLGLVLLSGGASAMMPLPAEGISLADKLAVTKLLHSSGATITEMNAVRKQLSRIKGGKLAEAWSGDKAIGSLWTLAISDVVGGAPDVIGSGPTVPDSGTARGALDCLDRYGLLAQVPQAVIRCLLGKVKGMLEAQEEYPWSKYVLVGDNRRAIKASMVKARALGWRTLDLGSSWEVDATAFAEMVVALTRNVMQDGVWGGAPLCVLLGGETNLKLGKKPGLGGRNQHLALLVNQAMTKPWMTGASWLFGGTDGEDGPTFSAGGFADFAARSEMERKKVDILEAVASFSSHDALQEGGALLNTGPTGTNVADLWVGLLHRP